MRRATAVWIIAFFAFFLPVLVWAGPQLRPQNDTESLRDYLNAVAPLDEEAAKKEATERTQDDAIAEQAASPAGTAAAPGFAERVGNTLQNFLPLFQGLVDAVNTSDDEKSVTLRLNPIRGATFGELGLSAAATEPEPFAALLEKLSEDSRAGEAEAIQKGLDDFTNLAFTATYNYARRLEPEHLNDSNPRRWFFGRNPRLYEQLFAELVGDTLRSFPPQNSLLEPFLDRFPGIDIESQRRGELIKTLGEAEYRKLEVKLPKEDTECGERKALSCERRKAWVEKLGQGEAQRLAGTLPREEIERQERLALVERLGEPEYRKLLDALILYRRSLAENLIVQSRKRAELFGQLTANQPQANLTVTYHDRDPLVGRRETSATLSFEMPAVPNINELLRSWRRSSNNWGTALTDLSARKAEIEAGTKWSLMATYKDSRPYQLSYLPAADGASPVTLDLPGSHELSIKAQYSRNATWQKLNVEGQETYPAFHFAAEIIEVSGDPTRNDRQVFTLTYDVPTRKGVSFPVSLVYANRSEFLGEADHQFGAHFGLNLNSLFGDQ